jgi:peptidoglycan/xylan/chitin deacetylase (PgdA/CDA1 family)
MTPGLHTLLYHRVQPRHTSCPDLAPDLISATPRVFERHLRYLARYCSPVGADEVIAAIGGRQGLPSRAVLVTFDDGYRDFAEFAWPLLKQYRIPCVLFVSTAFPSDLNRQFWWDALWQLVSRTRGARVAYGAAGGLPLATDAQRSRAYAIVSEWLKTQSAASRRTWLDLLGEQLEVRPMMSGRGAVLAWDELRALVRDGLVVAPHGQLHELLDQVDAATLRCEVRGSRDDIAREIGYCPPLFAYPNGNFDARVVRELGAAGYQGAFTTIGGRDALPAREPFMLRREQARGSLSRLALKLMPAISAWRTARKPLPRPSF